MTAAYSHELGHGPPRHIPKPTPPNQKGAKIMTEHEIIKAGREHLYNAGVNLNAGNHKQYCKHMSACLDLLIEELVGPPPKLPDSQTKNFNPEIILNEIAIAIKHRTISDTHRWKIIYYYDRITCVPTYVSTPEQIILHEFTDKMAKDGFSTIYWNQCKTNVIKLYKELHK